MRRSAEAGAVRALAAAAGAFAAAGYRTAELERLRARLEGGPVALALAIRPRGRVFGGAFGLEISTADPVLPPTRGLRGRGRGVVRLARVSFRGARGDRAGARLADALARDAALAESLREVHFEEIRVEADGRPVIRHMGGSVVWVLFPPFVRTVPLVPEQARASAEALAAFARVTAGG